MGFFNKIKEGAGKAADLAKETVEITRLNTQITAKRKEIDKNNNRIGELIFSAFQKNDMDAVESQVTTICQDIAMLQQDIQNLDLKIQEVKNEKNCVCGKTIALHAKFCPSCGHPFVVDEE
ncbi:MAG: zinc-ribbon domain-containing protein [Paenibacillaceae bacterium]